MYRKIAIIFISVFLAQAGTIIQALVVFVFILLCLLLNYIHRPFIAQALNRLEAVSLISSSITVYSGLFYLNAKEVTDPTFNI